MESLTNPPGSWHPRIRTLFSAIPTRARRLRKKPTSMFCMTTTRSISARSFWTRSRRRSRHCWAAAIPTLPRTPSRSTSTHTTTNEQVSISGSRRVEPSPTARSSTMTGTRIPGMGSGKARRDRPRTAGRSSTEFPFRSFASSRKTMRAGGSTSVARSHVATKRPTRPLAPRRRAVLYRDSCPSRGFPGFSPSAAFS